MKIDLTNHNDYLIASAVRGPDFDCEVLKYILTGAIRYMLGMGGNAGITVRRQPLQPEQLTTDSLARWATEIVGGLDTSGWMHYLGHCWNALGILRERGYDVEPLRQFIDTVIDVGCGRIGYCRTERHNIIKDALRELARAEEMMGRRYGAFRIPPCSENVTVNLSCSPDAVTRLVDWMRGRDDPPKHD